MSAGPEGFVPWECSRCGKQVLARPDFLVLCTCGTVTRAAESP